MRLHIQAVAETLNSTLSVVTVQGRFLCFCLEDGYRDVKVKGETRIPPGVYHVGRRVAGSFYARHRELWGHEFVPQLLDVPGFTDILIHPGNSTADTAGCLLFGFSATFEGDFSITRSGDAFKKAYSLIDDAFKRGEAVTVEISRQIMQAAATIN